MTEAEISEHANDLIKALGFTGIDVPDILKIANQMTVLLHTPGYIVQVIKRKTP